MSSPASRLDAPLRAERLTLDEWRRREATGRDGAAATLPQGAGAPPPAPLGLLAYGSGAPHGVAAQLLGDGEPRVDLWWGAASGLQSGRSGSVAWRSDGQWLHGVLELGDTDDTDDTEAAALDGPSLRAAPQASLATLTHRAYQDVFAALEQSGCTHLLRVWNYLPRINAEGGGLERYRQFNFGRQQAFIEAGRSTVEGVPVACALGTRGGPLHVSFLAARDAMALPIDNPRQVAPASYPDAYGPRSPTFSRAALLDVGAGRLALFVAGTASIVGHASMHAGDVLAQTHETLRNLEAIVAQARARCTARFALSRLDCVVYVRQAAHWPAVREVLASALGADSLTLRGAVALQADVCRSDLLIEIEAHAFEPGELLP